MPACFPIRVRARAHNRKCWNEWSDTNTGNQVRVQTKDASCSSTLGRVGQISSKFEKEKIFLTWQQPKNSNIITYIVMVKAVTGRFRALTDHCDETKDTRICSFP
jgi:hypothetical protein